MDYGQIILLQTKGGETILKIRLSQLTSIQIA